MSEYNYYEYLKNLLSFAKKKDVEPSAEKLVHKFDTLSCLMQIDRFLLSDTLSGEDEVANYIRLVSAITSRRITDKYKNGKKYSQNELKKYIVGLFFGADIERVFILLFDEADRLISTDALSDGTINSSGFLPRKLLDIAIRKKAKKVIITHNHPRGDAEPSSSDIITTNVAKSVLDNAGIKLTNHYIVAGFDVYDVVPDLKDDSAASKRRLRNSLTSAGVNKKGK